MVTAPAIDLRKPSAEKSRLSCPRGIRSTGLREEPSGTLQCVTAGTTLPSDFAPCLSPRPCASGFLNVTDYLNLQPWDITPFVPSIPKMGLFPLHSIFVKVL